MNVLGDATLSRLVDRSASYEKKEIFSIGEMKRYLQRFKQENERGTAWICGYLTKTYEDLRKSLPSSELSPEEFKLFMFGHLSAVIDLHYAYFGASPTRC